MLKRELQLAPESAAGEGSTGGIVDPEGAGADEEGMGADEEH